MFGHAAADSYAAAFRAYGIDVLTLEPPEEAARLIGQRERIRVRLAAALDDWLVLEVHKPVARRLLAVARAADPHPFRNRLRETVAAVDRAKLKQLAQEAAALDLEAGLTSLGRRLTAGRRAWRSRSGAAEGPAAHPAEDFWVNDILGVYLLGCDPSQPDEAGRLATRPRRSRCAPNSHFVYDNLGIALTWQCRWTEAIAAHEQAIDKKPDFFKGYHGLADALAAQRLQQGDRQMPGRRSRKSRDSFTRAFTWLDSSLRRDWKQESLAQARKGVEKHPDSPFALIGLGEALVENNQADQAVAAYEQAALR